MRLVVGRHVLRPGDPELAASIEGAFSVGEGELLVREASSGRELRFLRGLACNSCGRRFEEPTPAHFSFNSPRGACRDLPGLRAGRGPRRWRRSSPTRVETLRERPFAPFNTPAYASAYPDLARACRRLGIRRDVPWNELTARERDARLGRRRRLVRREGALHVPRDEALQGARPRDDREVPRLRALPGLPRGAADARRRASVRVGGATLAGALRPAARRAPREAPRAPSRGGGEGAGRLARGGPREARRDARRRRALLPLAVADDADPLRRRGAEGPARRGARQRPHRDALRPGRADRRAPPVATRRASSPCSGASPTRGTPSASSSTTSTSSARRTTSSTSARTPGPTAAGSSSRGRRGRSTRAATATGEALRARPGLRGRAARSRIRGASCASSARERTTWRT